MRVELKMSVEKRLGDNAYTLNKKHCETYREFMIYYDDEFGDLIEDSVMVSEAETFNYAGKDATVHGLDSLEFWETGLES